MARILIIDDDAGSLKALSLVLDGRIAAEIETCDSALASLKRITATEFDAVISDIKMPGMDGLSLLKEIRTRSPNTPIILTTAYDEPEFAVQSLRAGAFDFIRKPYDVEYFVASVTRAIHHSQSTRDLEVKQKAIEQRAAELEQYRLLVESLVDHAIFTLDADGRVMSWNVGAERIKGYRSGEIIGKHFSCFYQPDDVKAGTPDKELRAAALHGRSEDEGWRLRKDGSRFWANVVTTALKDESGKLRGFAKVTRDLTERKRAEEAKERLFKEHTARQSAEAANRAKDQFFATLSHELRSPLTPMLGWTRILLTGNPDTDMQIRGLNVIQRNVNAQAKLIEDILDVSRIITGKFTLNTRSLNLVHVVEAAIDVIRPSADAKHLRIDVSRPNDAIKIMGDADRLQQVVWNLLTNAVKFTPNQGQIQIRLACNDSEARLTISDSGVGLKPEFLPHIFERFSQADSSSTKVHGGLGIGLSLVKNLVELHGGSVCADSAGLGKGTTFIVTLPVRGVGDLHEPSSEESSQMRSSPSSRILQGLKLLVVDDEPDARELLSVAFRMSGAHVTAAASVHEAIECYHREKPDVIISDVGMPVEDGFALIGKIRTLEADMENRTPAIALTAFAQDADRTRCLSAGFQMHVPKPIDPMNLVMIVSKFRER